MPKILSMQGITKRFPGVLANDQVTLECETGEIRALLGENGAGKTTLMNVLYGLLKPDEGSIFINDQNADISSPRDALALGIGMIHQHFMLIPYFTVLQNVIVGAAPKRGPLVDWEQAEEQVTSIATKYNLDIDPSLPTWQLSVCAQQRVEILKLLYRRARLLILDEPTAALGPQEVSELFSIMRGLAESGYTIIFITHKLKEVMEISDSVTVLRHGRVVSTRAIAETNPQILAKEMVGREPLGRPESRGAPGDKVILSLRGLCARDDRNLMACDGIDLEVHEGEIVGIAGVDGNGQSELAQVLTGLRPIEAGQIELAGHTLGKDDPWEFITQGVAHVPEDRQKDGLIMEFSLADNLVLQMHRLPPFSRYGVLDNRVIRSHGVELMERFDVRAPGPLVAAQTLSGGNQQRLVLARELSRRPVLLVASHPTRGLDVGSTEYIQRELLDAKQAGSAILLISQDLDELLALSDRIAVMYRGQVVGILPAQEASVGQIGLMMTGTC